MLNYLKYEIFKRPLALKKTHDFGFSRNPKVTVIFIHGIGSSSISFTNALKYLEGTVSLRDVRFVAYDLLGAGKSFKGRSLNYTFGEEIEALHNSILKLKLKTPIILVGHSMGTLIAERYANKYKKSIAELILVSPPVYTPEVLADPRFAEAIKLFKESAKQKNPKAIKHVSFDLMMENMVLNKKNYKVLSELKTKAILIYGDKDEIIASFNIPKVIKENPKYLSAIITDGKHGVSRDKYNKIREILEEYLNENL